MSKRVANSANYQLYRTLPKLGGNMQLDLVISPHITTLDNKKQIYVSEFHVRPIRNRGYKPNLSEDLTNSPHQINISQFFKDTQSIFYGYKTDLESSNFLVYSKKDCENIKYLQNWDDVYWCGTQRMKIGLYGTTHETLVPVWIECSNGVKLIIEILDEVDTVVDNFELNLSKDCVYNPEQKFHNKFVKYLLAYFEYCNFTKGNVGNMYLDFDKNKAYLRGIDVRSGNLVTTENLHILNNLTHRERPLLEGNSLLTNLFPDNYLITPQLINFNICFNSKDFFTTSSNTLTPYKIRVRVHNLSDVNLDNTQNLKWKVLEQRDIYTNHEYIPRQLLADNYSEYSQFYDDDTLRLNALDYLKDNTNTNIIHENKIVQNICHWSPVDSHNADLLFNVYDGMGSYSRGDKDGFKLNQHTLPLQLDLTETKYNRATQNITWAGTPAIGDGREINEIFANPEKYIKNGYLKDLTQQGLGVGFIYTPNNVFWQSTNSTEQIPKKIFLGMMTTQWVSNPDHWKTMFSSKLVSRQNVIGILQEHLDAEGRDILPENRNSTTYGKVLDKGEWDEFTFADLFNSYASSDQTFRYFFNRKLLSTYTNTDWNNLQTELFKTTNKIGYLKEYHILRKIQKNEPHFDDMTFKEGEHEYERLGGTLTPTEELYDSMHTNKLCIVKWVCETDTEYYKTGDWIVIAFNPRTSKSETNQTLNTNIVRGDILPHGLTYGGFIKAIQQYCKHYLIISRLFDVLETNQMFVNTEKKPNSLFLELLQTLVAQTNIDKKSNPTSTIYINKSLDLVRDNTLSHLTKEILYQKNDKRGNFLWRKCGTLRPAMFPDRTIRQAKKDKDHDIVLLSINKYLKYQELYGRNFAYVKQQIFLDYPETITETQNLFIKSGISPKYPSIEFNSVVPMVRKGEDDTPCYQTKQGDIMYNEPYPVLLGYSKDGKLLKDKVVYKDYVITDTNPLQLSEKKLYNSYIHSEYKWFWKSTFISLPTSLMYYIKTDSNDLEYLENVVYITSVFPRKDMPTVKDKTNSEINVYEKFLKDFNKGQNRYFYNDINGTIVELSQKYLDLSKYPENNLPQQMPFFYDKLQQNITLLDWQFIKQWYTIKYDLLEASPQLDSNGQYKKDIQTGEILYSYTYRISLYLQ